MTQFCNTAGLDFFRLVPEPEIGISKCSHDMNNALINSTPNANVKSFSADSRPADSTSFCDSRKLRSQNGGRHLYTILQLTHLTGTLWQIATARSDYVLWAKKSYKVLEIELLAVPDTLEFARSNKANRLYIAL